jgi:hypothetical protein
MLQTMILAIDQQGVTSKGYETALPAVSSKKDQPCQAYSASLYNYFPLVMSFLAILVPPLKNAYFN